MQRIEVADSVRGVPVHARAFEPRSAEIAECEAILEHGRAQVKALAASLRGLPPGRARWALQREITGVKRQTRVEVLRVHARHARLRGDPEALIQIDRALQNRLAPSSSVRVPTVKKPAQVERKGGAR